MERLDYLDVINMDNCELISLNHQIRAEQNYLEQLERWVGGLLVERLKKPTERYTYD